jgi:hypothetical protein
MIRSFQKRRSSKNGEATQQLIELGVRPSIARDLVSRKDLGSSALLEQIPKNIAGKSRTIARALSKRRDALAAAEARLVAHAAKLEANLQSKFDSWIQRLEKAGISVPADGSN